MTGVADSTTHMPESERWEFDGEVTKVFDDMLERSIPQYQTMRRTVTEIGLRFGERRDGLKPWVFDIGCSRGGALAPFVEAGWAATGIEISEPMVEAARDRFAGVEGVTIDQADLRDPILGGRLGFTEGANVMLSVLTLQFVPINYRQRIVRECYEGLLPGGAMILVEKVLGDGARMDQLMVDTYHDAKQQAGYSREAIEVKRLALEGVLVPVTADWNVDLLRKAGFREVDCFWRWMNFAGWVAVK